MFSSGSHDNPFGAVRRNASYALVSNSGVRVFSQVVDIKISTVMFHYFSRSRCVLIKEILFGWCSHIPIVAHEDVLIVIVIPTHGVNNDIIIEIFCF